MKKKFFSFLSFFAASQIFIFFCLYLYVYFSAPIESKILFINTAIRSAPSSTCVSTGSPKILPTSQCTVWSDVVTCICIVQNSPVPTVKWPILKNLTEYSVTTTVSGNTMNSTIVLAAQENIAKVNCNIGKLKKTLNVINAGAWAEATTRVFLPFIV